MSFNILSFIQKALPNQQQLELHQTLLDGLAMRCCPGTDEGDKSFALESFQLVSKLFIEHRTGKKSDSSSAIVCVVVPPALVACWTAHRAAILSVPLLRFSLLCLLAPDHFLSSSSSSSAAVGSSSTAIEKQDYRTLVKIVISACTSANKREASSATASSFCPRRFFGDNDSALFLFARDLLFQSGNSSSSADGTSLLFGGIMALWQQVLSTSNTNNNNNAAEPLFHARRRVNPSSGSGDSSKGSSNSNSSTAKPFLFSNNNSVGHDISPRVLLSSSLSFRFVCEVSGHFVDETNDDLASSSFSSSAESEEVVVPLSSSSVRRYLLQQLSSTIDSPAQQQRQRFIRVDSRNAVLLLMLIRGGDSNNVNVGESVQDEEESFARDCWMLQSCLQLQTTIARRKSVEQQQQKQKTTVISIASHALDDTFVFAGVPYHHRLRHRQYDDNNNQNRNSTQNDDCYNDGDCSRDTAPKTASMSSAFISALSSPTGISLLLQRAFSAQKIGASDALPLAAATWLARILFELVAAQESSTVSASALETFCEETAKAACRLVSELKAARQHLGGNAAEALQQWTAFKTKQQMQNNNIGHHDDESFEATLDAFEKLLLIWCLFSGTLMSETSAAAEENNFEEEQDESLVVSRWIASLSQQEDVQRDPWTKFQMLLHDLLHMLSESSGGAATTECVADYLNKLSR